MWLEEARQIAVKIPADIHGVERDRALADTATVALEVGSEAQAENVVREVSGWRRGDLFARLAGRCYATSRMPAGDRFIALAQEVAQDAALEAWQRSRIGLAIERARLARPSAGSGSEEAVSQLEPADQAALLPALVQHSAAASNLVATLVRLEAVTNQVLDLDAAAATVDAYRVLYQKARGMPQTTDYRNRVYRGVLAAFASLHPAIACDKLIDLSEAANAGGDTNFVTLLCGEVEQRLELVRADMRVPVQTRYARFLGTHGQAARGREYLEGAVRLLDDSSVLADERPVALARIGAAWGELGDVAGATASFRQAVDSLRLLINSRPRAVAGVQICLSFARACVDDPVLANRMREVQEGLGEPW